MNDMKIEKVWLSDDAVWIRTADGQEAYEKFDDYPRLKWATTKQRSNFETSAYGIHWPDIDEDLSYEGFFREKKVNPLYDLFMNHPELNASAIARRMGISQSLFARYISGTKNPSAKRMKEIFQTINLIGDELKNVIPTTSTQRH